MDFNLVCVTVFMTKEGIKVITFLNSLSWEDLVITNAWYSQCWYVRNHVILNPDFYVVCIKKISTEAERGTYTFQNTLTVGCALFFFVTPFQSGNLCSRPKDVTN